MIAERMTSRRRILASIHGDEVDRFPVWLKMDNGTWQSAQPEPYRSMDSLTLLTECGCDVMGSEWASTASENPNIRKNVDIQTRQAVTTWETPDGTLTAVDGIEPISGSWHPAKYAIETAEDMAIARWLFTDVAYSTDPDDVKAGKQRQAKWERDGVVTSCGIGPSPLMMLVEQLAGPENTNYLAVDEPEAFAELVELMQQDMVRMLKVMLPAQSADTCWMTENTSTTLTSPTQFRQYCLPHLREYGQMMLDNDIIPVHHMCGTLNALLEDIDELPALVNEAYTTDPLGDVSLAAGRTRMPSKSLWGGTNATLLLEPVETIVQTVADDLAACPDTRKIFLTSAGVLPPPVSFEKAKELMARFKELPV